MPFLSSLRIFSCLNKLKRTLSRSRTFRAFSSALRCLRTFPATTAAITDPSSPAITQLLWATSDTCLCQVTMVIFWLHLARGGLALLLGGYRASNTTLLARLHAQHAQYTHIHCFRRHGNTHADWCDKHELAVMLLAFEVDFYLGKYFHRLLPNGGSKLFWHVSQAFMANGFHMFLTLCLKHKIVIPTL